MKKNIKIHISNEYGDEWDNLQSHVQQYSKKQGINGWDFIYFLLK